MSWGCSDVSIWYWRSIYIWLVEDLMNTRFPPDAPRRCRWTLERKRGEPSAPFLSKVKVPAKLPPDFATRGRKPLRSLVPPRPYPSVFLNNLVSRFATFCIYLGSCLHSYRKDVSYGDRDWISREADNFYQTGLADELAIVFAARMFSFSL